MKNTKWTKLVLAYALLLWSGATNAQHQLPDSAAYWTINNTSWDNSYPTLPIGLDHDTVINGNSYRSVYVSSDTLNWSPNKTKYKGALRESNKTWLLRLPNDTIDHVIYDFGLSKGDTGHLYSVISHRDVLMYVVDEDSVLLENMEKRRRLHLKYQTFEEQWIEGIGSSNGLLNSGMVLFDVGSHLICFHEDGNVLYIDSPNNTCYYAGMLNIDEKQSLMRIYPNPGNRRVVVELLDNDANQYLIEIYDQNGKLIRSEKVIGSKREINVEQLNSGNYYMRAVSNSTDYGYSRFRVD